MSIYSFKTLKPKQAAGALICASMLLFSNVQADAGDPAVSMLATSINVSAPLSVSVTKLVMRVAGPDGKVKKYKSEGDSISVDFSGMPDGAYNYESWSIGENNGERYKTGLTRGRFKIAGGTIVVDSKEINSAETSMTAPQSNLLIDMLSSVVEFIIPAANAQTVTVSDGFPQLEFDDTSATSNNDNDDREWVIIGDENRFGIYDDSHDLGSATEGNSDPNFTRVIHIEALTSTDPLTTTATTVNSLLIEDTGNMSFADETMYLNKASGKLGLGTTTPVSGIHSVTDGQEQSIRLENTLQSTWVMGQFDGLFGASDADGDFRISITENGNGGSTGTMLAIDDENNNVAVDTLTITDTVNAAPAPNGALSIQRADGETKFKLIETNPTVGARNMMTLRNNGPVAFRFQNDDNGSTWFFQQTNDGSFKFDDAGTGAVEFRLSPNGNLAINGMLSEGSSRDLKKNITPVDNAKLLEKLDGLTIQNWTYKADDKSNHIGPIAEDFYEVFGLGKTDKKISSLDVAGIALAAVKELKQLNAKQDELISAQQDLVQQQAAKIATLEAQQSEILALKQSMEELRLSLLEKTNPVVAVNTMTMK